MYSWGGFQPVLDLEGIKPKSYKKDVPVICPFCKSERFFANLDGGYGYCQACKTGADSPQWYAAMESTFNGRSLTVQEARNEIEEKLGIKDSYNPPAEQFQRKGYTKYEEEPLAPIEMRDAVYRAFLYSLKLNDRNKRELIGRGFNEETLESLLYRSFPTWEEADYFGICRKIISMGLNLKGVPGFYQVEKSKSWTFVKLRPGVIMPSRNENGLIQFLQVRKNEEEIEEGDGKCSWFSSAGKLCGTGAQSPVSFSVDFRFSDTERKFMPVLRKAVMLTEGTMKADLVHDLEPKFPVISVAGVGNTKYLPGALSFLKERGITSILLAYDMDYRTNPHVKDSMDATRKMIKDAGIEVLEQPWDTTVEVETAEGLVKMDLLKGIDDHLAYFKKGILPSFKK